jgi:3-dehydroquinate synthase
MFIVIDPEVLLTLEDKHLYNGIAESIKHALTQNQDFFQYLMANNDKIRDFNFLEEVVKKTIELKVPLLNGDVADDYNEMLPQYGHSVGHAAEHLSAYDLLHGEAISIGMCVSAEIAKLLGLCDQDIVDLHYAICEKYNLPTTVPDYINDEDIVNMIKYDKHHLKGNPQMGLVEKIGQVWKDKNIHSVPVDYVILRRAISINKCKGASHASKKI